MQSIKNNRRDTRLARSIRSIVETLESRQLHSVSYLTEGTSFPVGDQPIEVLAADFNADGKMDAATADYTSKSITILLNDGSANFTTSQTVTLPGEVEKMRAADINGDGKLDLVARENNGNDFQILPGNGDGTFGPATTLNGSGSGDTFDVGDVNGDGKIDIVAPTNSGGDTGISVYLNKGTGFEFNVRKPFAGIASVYNVHLADVNGDNKLDVLTVGPSSDAPAGVFLNSGTGEFPTQSGFQTRFTSQKVELDTVDITGDGRLDLVVLYQGGSFDVLPGDGSGGFGTATGTSPLGGADLAVVDMNGDGKLDVVSASDTYGAVSVTEGNGDGTFQEDNAEYLFGSNATDFQVADFNGDGKPDVVVADKGDDELIFVANTSTGTGGNDGGGNGGPVSPPPPPAGAAFDLTSSLQGDLPSAVIGGEGKGKLSVGVTNTGGEAVNGAVTISLYASKDGTIDAGDTLITSVVKKLKISAGRAKNIAMKFVFPSVADGNYQLLTKVQADGETNTANNSGASAGTVQIAAPFVDLSPSVQSVSSKNDTLKASIALQNLGNAAANGDATFTLTAVPSAGGEAVTIGTVTRRVNIKAGASKKVTLSLNVPPSVAAGDYKLGVQVSGLGDVNSVNDAGQSSSTFTIG